MKIIWIGFHEEGLDAFEKILAKGINIDAFITLENERLTKKSAYSNMYERICDKYKISFYQVKSVKDKNTEELLKRLNPDLIIVLGWSEILPSSLLKIPTGGVVGTHAAMLPHNRGSAPVNWAIIRGETEGGNTLMWLNEQVDAGKIIDQISFPITIYDTCASVYKKVSDSNTIMIDRLLIKLFRKEEVIERESLYEENEILPRRRPKDGEILWHQSAKQIYDFVRALTRPYPGAFTFLNKKKWVIWRCSLLEGNVISQCPGTILGNIYSTEEMCCGIAVAAISGIILIQEIESEKSETIQGKKIHEIDLKGIFEDEEDSDCCGPSR